VLAVTGARERESEFRRLDVGFADYFVTMSRDNEFLILMSICYESPVASAKLPAAQHQFSFEIEYPLEIGLENIPGAYCCIATALLGMPPPIAVTSPAFFLYADALADTLPLT